MNILNEIHKIISSNAELFTCVGFLAGTLLGNWLAIGQDKREEFNQIADPLSEALIQIRACPTVDNTIDFFQFKRTLNRWELFRFNKCVERYERAKENARISYDSTDSQIIRVNSGHYRDPTPIIAAIDELLKFTKRR